MPNLLKSSCTPEVYITPVKVFLSIKFLNISTFPTILQTETSVFISQAGRTLDQVTHCGLF